MDKVLVSPGVYDRVFDGTFRPASPVGIGSAIIAPRAKGPAMEPILVKDRDEDEAIFGLPKPDGKDFGAYAARAFLDVETNPLTVIRVLGIDDTGVLPGFSIGNAGGLYAIGASGSHVGALVLASGTLSLAGAMTSSIDSLAVDIDGYGAVTASLLRSSNRHISKVLNTDPSQYERYKHVVLAVYDYAEKVPLTDGFFAAKIPGGNDWHDSFITGSTPEVISQPFGLTEYGLFGIGNRFAGDSANREWKVTIMNIKKSPNPDVSEYGTFTLVVRKYDDNDRNPVVLESFSNLTLDPNAPNYICRVIGDMYRVWNKTTKKFDEFGEYENKSKYIYIIPSIDLKNGNVPASALPFGFRGYGGLSDGAFGNKASMPDMPFVKRMTYKNDFNTRVCWGVEVVSNSGVLNYGVLDRAMHLPKGLTAASGAVGASFSLKWLSASVSSVPGFSDSSRLTDNQISALSTSIAYDPTVASPVGGVDGYLTLENIENTPLAKFTLVPADGFDGVDITKANPFDPQDMASTTAYQTHAYRTALDMISDPESQELNDLAIPGVWAQKVTDYAIDMVENRGDMFYIMDISGSSVDDAIDDVTVKNVDSHYAACYYPWLRMEDTVNRKLVDVPPTVVMPAVYAFSDSVSYAWYAPAGFSRGGLERHGIKKVKDKVKKSERDKLQENRINPIASFSNEGIVVWGQKTLQKAASARDRINVMRMLLRVRRMIAKEATKVVFEPNVSATWDKFVNRIEPQLEQVKRNFGIREFKLILDERTTTEDLVERNIMYGKIAIVPTRSAEMILLDFFLTNTVAGFDE